MEYAYSILMFCFAGMLLLYAGLLALTKDAGLIPRSEAVEMRDKKAYARQFAKVMALVALAPVLSGLVALAPWLSALTGVVGAHVAAFLVLVLAFVGCIRVGVRLMRDVSG